LVAVGATSEGATYVPVTDASLVDRAPVAIVGRVEAVDTSARASVYRFSVERVLKGFVPGPVISVSVPGGDTFVVPGMPRFFAGQRVILFLSPHPDGTFQIVELMLGAFKESAVPGSINTRAQRDLTGSHSLGDPKLEPGRDFEEFATWIEARARGERRSADYVRPAEERAAADSNPETAPYTLLGNPSRFTEFDEGFNVLWFVRLGGSTLTGGGVTTFLTALNAYNLRTDAYFNFVYMGTNANATGIVHDDGLNTVLINDPFGDIPGAFDCTNGGVLAIGGYKPSVLKTHMYKGSIHRTIEEGDIVTQNGSDCAFLRNSELYGVQVLGHELGHVVGLGHSCGDAGSGACVVGSAQDDALMRATIHNDSRGARFGTDDIDALNRLYDRAVWVSDPSVSEGNGGARTLDFTISLSASHTKVVTVDYFSADGSGSNAAIAGSDYWPVQGTATFSAGETSKLVSVNIIGDSLYEADEALALVLYSSSNAGIRKERAVGTITNDDSAPTVSIGSSSVSEGNSGTKSLTFNLTLSSSSGLGASVTASTSNGTATAGSDYVAKTESVTIPAGQTSSSFSVVVNGDTLVEGNESLTVTLSSPTGATLGTSTATGTITNDDIATAPLLSTPLSSSVGSTSATLGGTVTSDGGSAITERGVVYSLTTTNSNPVVSGSGVTTAIVTGSTGAFTFGTTGLLPASGYSFRAYARNTIGTAYTSLATFTTLATVPGAPVIGAAAAGDTTVSVTFTSPTSNGGASITGYTATCGGKTASGSASAITVTALTNGVAVTCTVVATNVRGNSASSAASNSVTPAFLGTAIPRLKNISTRGRVETGDRIMIGGFIVGGSGPKKVVITGRGPSMAALGVSGTLADPAIRLFSGATPIDFNDNWQTASNAAEVTASTFAPTDPREAAILASVIPGVPYTVHLTGVSETTGIAIIEVFELDVPENPLLNISTRGSVQTGDNVMIGGFIIQGNAAQRVLITARGPALADLGVPGVLADPTLELYQAGNPTPIASNDNWGQSTDAAAILAAGNAPTNALESAIIRTLSPGAYTAIVRGNNAGLGIGIVEVFKK